MKKQAIPRLFPMNLRLTRVLSAISRQSGAAGRTMPPLTRGRFAPGPRWSADMDRETFARRSLTQGTLGQFIAAKNAPQSIRTQFPPTVWTNENMKFYENPQVPLPEQSAPFGEGYAPKMSEEDALRFLKAALS